MNLHNWLSNFVFRLAQSVSYYNLCNIGSSIVKFHLSICPSVCPFETFLEKRNFLFQEEFLNFMVKILVNIPILSVGNSFVSYGRSRPFTI